MEAHVKVLGAIYIALGALGLVATVVVMLLFGGIIGLAALDTLSPDAAVGLPIAAAFGVVVAVAALALSIPAIVIGWGLLTLRPWAWLAGVILSCLMLINFPFGTAVAIYGLVVLLSSNTGPLFGRTPTRSQAVP